MLVLLPIIIVLCTVLLIRFIEQKEYPWLTKFFNWVPAILLAYLIPAGVTALLQKDFSTAEIHDLSKSIFIPLAIVAVMSSFIPQTTQIDWLETPFGFSFGFVLDCGISHWHPSNF